MGTYLITGIGRGIGQELARALLGRGDRVIGTLRSLDGAEKDWGTPMETGQMRLVQLDVRDEASIERAARVIDEPVDVLVNNAGIIGPSRQSTLDMDFDGFLDTLRVNTLGPLRIVQAFLPYLRRSSMPKIVTISSAMGSVSHAKSDRIAYRASKAAINKIVQGLATDLQEDGIVVVSVHPGWVRTDMGGGAADISVEESTGGLIALIDRLSLESTGGFFNWRGERIPF